jgi:hypothetical protein
MIHKIKSIGALDLRTNWNAFLDDRDNPSVQPAVELEVVETGSSAPVEGGMVRKEDYLVITVLPEGKDRQSQYDELRMAADSLTGQSVEIVGADEKGKEWYVMGRVSGHTMKKGVSKLIMQVVDSVWQDRSTTTQPTWNVTASGQTLNVSVGGSVEALPTLAITVRGAKAGGFLYRRWIRLYNPNSKAVVNEKVDITNGGWDTAALTTAKMQAGGEDLRVYDKGKEVDRELAAMDTASTKVFAGPFTFQPKIEMTLSGSIANSGVPTSITVKDTPTNNAMLVRLPNERQLIEIDNERFIYNGRDLKSRRIYIEARTVRGSSIASHADGATIKWLEHDVWVYYGNSTLAAPENDPTKAAAFDIASSTNASRVYTSFGDKAAVRPGAWRLAVLKRMGPESIVYTGAGGDTITDPMTEMGLLIKTYLNSGKPAAENANLEARFSHPGKITSVTPTALKKRVGTSWPTTMALQKSKDGVQFTNQFNESTPATAGSFGSITNTGTQTLGADYEHVRFYASGGLPAVLDNAVYLEVQGVTVVITNPITAAMQGEEDNYDLDCEIQNTFTYQGETVTESMFLRWTMGIDETITINSEMRAITHSDGTNAYRALQKLDVERLEWLAFRPGVTNQLKLIDAGTTDLDIDVSYVERRKR